MTTDRIAKYQQQQTNAKTIMNFLLIILQCVLNTLTVFIV